MMNREWTRGGYTITTDRGRVDVDAVHAFLARSYWAEGRSRERVRRAIDASVPFSLHERNSNSQVGFARVVTDFVSVAYLADVYVLETHRGRGLGRWLVETSTSLPELSEVRRWLLATRDAHGLYAKVGFTAGDASRLMQGVDLGVSDQR